MITAIILQQVAVPDTIYTALASSPSFLDHFVAFGPTLVGLAGLFIAWWQIRKAVEQNDKLLIEKQREEERQEIYKKLNEFYGPCQTLLRECKMLHDLFKHGRDFRTLTELLEGQEYTDNDKVMLKQVMNVTDRISNLIIEKSGLVEDDEEDLQKLLSQARAHYRILKLAYNAELTGDTDRFEDFVYPRELDRKIKQKKRSLEDRINGLRNIDDKSLDPSQ